MASSILLILILLALAAAIFMAFKFRSKWIWFFSLLLVFILPFANIFILYNLLSKKFDYMSWESSVIVILGAGIRNDIPSEILKRRLETGKEIYDQTRSKIIVTGDNSSEYHNEPRVMKNYLIKLGVKPSVITEDFGGRRTMDSCYRVKNFFGANNIILVSQAFHLPRAKFLCESVGLGVLTRAAQDTGPSTVIWGYLREIPAAWSALVDSLYFKPQVGSDGSEEIN
jgi:SanA protein